MLVSDKAESEVATTKILHPGCRILFRYWESLRAERTCPRKDEIDLKQISQIVPYLTIIEQVSTFKPWQFRLAGTKVCEIFGQEMTGHDALEGWDQFERNIVSKCLDLSKNRLQPSLVRMRFIGENGDVIAAEMISLPLQNGGKAPVHLIGGIFPFLDEKPKRPFLFQKRELVSARMVWTEHGLSGVGDLMVDVLGRKAPVQLYVIQGGLI